MVARLVAQSCGMTKPGQAFELREKQMIKLEDFLEHVRQRDPDQPNLRQVHLIAAELVEEMNAKGYDLSPGSLGENILTRGIDLIHLPRGTRLRFESGAEVEITGLRNPCGQIESFRQGLLAEMARKRADGAIERRAGIMAIVTKPGAVRTGETISIALPPKPHLPLERV